jgi:hypothetical protein
MSPQFIGKENMIRCSLTDCVAAVIVLLVVLVVATSNAVGDDNNGGGYASATTNPTASAATQPSTEPSAVTGVARSTAWIRLKWKPVSGNVYYEVYRAMSADFQLDDNSQISPALLIPSFDDDRVTAGKTYYYKVIAVQSASPFPVTEVGAVSVSTPKHDEPLRPLKQGEEN